MPTSTFMAALRNFAGEEGSSDLKGLFSDVDQVSPQLFMVFSPLSFMHQVHINGRLGRVFASAEPEPAAAAGVTSHQLSVSFKSSVPTVYLLENLINDFDDARACAVSTISSRLDNTRSILKAMSANMLHRNRLSFFLEYTEEVFAKSEGGAAPLPPHFGYAVVVVERLACLCASTGWIWNEQICRDLFSGSVEDLEEILACDSAPSAGSDATPDGKNALLADKLDYFRSKESGDAAAARVDKKAVLDRLEIVKPLVFEAGTGDLGAGAFATVRVARYDGKRVAVKVCADVLDYLFAL